MASRVARIAGVLIAASLMSACNGILDSGIPKHEKPIPANLIKQMKAKGMSAASPIMLRIFKQENVLEVWKKTGTQRYALLETYEICRWSGKLGPKHKEGDRQAPEGFYHVSRGLMNPNSSYHLSFNLGYPNTYDRAHERTGSYLMVHGACSSAGCYSMTDEYVEEIYALAREAFKGGQKDFQVQAYPFRMTPENMAKHVDHPSFNFWRMLKEGYDHFEITRSPPKVDVCERRYVFNREAAEEGVNFDARDICPPTRQPESIAMAFAEKQKKDQSIFDQVLKRTAASPFIKPELKPQTLSASILADSTEGELMVGKPEALHTGGEEGEGADQTVLKDATDAPTVDPENSALKQAPNGARSVMETPPLPKEGWVPG